MKLQRRLTLIALCSAAFVATLPAQEAPQELPSQAEMWQMIQAQQKQIEALSAMVQANQTEVSTTRTELASAKTDAASAKAEASTAIAQLKATQQQVEATSIAVEEIGESSFNAPGWWNQTSVDGYGELHANFNNGADNEMDSHRFVLFFNHEFNDWIRFFSELEVEHSISGDGQPGEVELEQAFIRMDWKKNFSTDAGLFLMPVGITNETHEPNTFYGVERNNIEARIIPSTWWEAGIKGNWRFDNGFSVDAGITSGLDIDSSGVIRSGRQKAAKAVNETPGYVGRVKYTGVPGLELGLSAYYQDDMAQSDPADIQGLLTSGHVDYRNGGFRLRALYARWDLDGTDSTEAESQSGYYLEPSYRWELDEHFGEIGVYFRYSDYQYFSGSLKDNNVYEIGINYWPTEYVVFKADLQDISDSDQWKSKGDKALNLGMGYQF